RAASDLAQVLLRKDELASDANSALQLNDRLQKVVKDSAESEKAFASKVGGLTPADQARERKPLDEDRTYTAYLCGCISRFMLPVGVPVLNDLAAQESGMEPEALAGRRRQALFALAVLGDSLKRFDRLSADRQDQIEGELEKAIETGLSGKTARA